MGATIQVHKAFGVNAGYILLDWSELSYPAAFLMLDFVIALALALQSRKGKVPVILRPSSSMAY